MNTDDYLETQVMTAPPHQLHLMVIEGAVRFAVQAKQALEQNDYEMSHLALSRSRDFVNELIAGLNGEQSPELVEQLKGLFAFAYERLVRADHEHDPKLVDDALVVLENHLQTWRDLVQFMGTSTSDSTSADGNSSQASREWVT